ncbi:MAG: FtsX-like permease family protein [Chloroflexota bacterium]|nr:FtsX-like permease family protein [Chloroflexota bacterium]
MLKFSILNTFRRKGIAVFAVLGTGLGIALMTVLLSISDGMDAQMTETMTELAGGIGVYPETAPIGYMIPSNTGFPISYTEDIKTIDHINEDSIISQVLTFVPTEVADYGDPMGVIMRGLDFGSELGEDNPFSTDNILEGRAPVGAGGDEVVIGSMLSTFGMSVGGEHTDVGDIIYMPVAGGEVVPLTIVGIFETENNFYDGSIFTDLDTARGLMPALSADEVNYISLEVSDTQYVQQVADEVDAMFADRDVTVSTVVAADLLGSINDMMSVFRNFLWIVSLVAAVAGGVSIFIVMLISVIERTKEFGILKASGWSNWNIISSVVFQSITVGLLGAAVGLAIGYGAKEAIDAYMTIEIGIITWRLVLIIVAFGVVMGITGGLYPALRAARVSPIESLRAL